MTTKKANYSKRKTVFSSAAKLIAAWLNQPQSASCGTSKTFSYSGNLLRGIEVKRDGTKVTCDYARLVTFNGRRVVIRLPTGWRGGGNARYRANNAIRLHCRAVAHLDQKEMDRLIACAWGQSVIDEILTAKLLESQDSVIEQIFGLDLNDHYGSLSNLSCDRRHYALREHNKMARDFGRRDLALCPPSDFVNFFRQFAGLSTVARTQSHYRAQLSFFHPGPRWTRPRKVEWRGNY